MEDMHGSSTSSSFLEEMQVDFQMGKAGGICGRKGGGELAYLAALGEIVIYSSIGFVQCEDGVMTIIEIVEEQSQDQTRSYRAMGGDQQATGATPGQALDTLDRMLTVQGDTGGGEMLVIVQRFRPDSFFTSQQQARLQELVQRFHDAGDDRHALSPEEQQELEQLVDAEWQAAIQRGSALLSQTPDSTL
ncbi:MAG TPA: hypothetical protein VF707_00915 [Ardenticatenaceae bacterium]|jgi:hypothetical protein